MRTKSRIGIGVGISMVAIAMVGTSPAFADEQPPPPALSGISNKVKFGLDNLPRDGVAYPVAQSWNAYTQSLHAPTNLVKGAVQKLNFSNENATMDMVADAYTNEKSFSLEPALNPGGKLNLGMKSSQTTTYTHGTTTTPKELNEVDVTANIDGVTATPTAFKLQGWGEYYKQGVGSDSPTQVGGLNTVNFDVTQATGWVLDGPNGQPLQPGDIK